MKSFEGSQARENFSLRRENVQLDGSFIHRPSRYPSILCSRPPLSPLWSSTCLRVLLNLKINRSLLLRIYLSIYHSLAMPAAHLILAQIEKRYGLIDYKLQRLMGITQRVIHLNLCEFSVNVSDQYLGRITTYITLRCKFYILRAIQLQQLIESNVLLQKFCSN